MSLSNRSLTLSSFLRTPTMSRRRRRMRGSSSSPRRSDCVDGYIRCVLQFFYCNAGADTFYSIKRARRCRRRARTRPGEHDSHDLPDAHHPNPFALPSSPQTTPRSLPEVDARRNTWPQFRRHRDHLALLPAPSVSCRDPGVLFALDDGNVIRDRDMRRCSLNAVSELAATVLFPTLMYNDD